MAKRTILGIRETPAVGASSLSVERTTPVDDVIVFFGASDDQGTSTVAATAALQAAQPLPTAAGALPVLPGEHAEIAAGGGVGPP